MCGPNQWVSALTERVRARSTCTHPADRITHCGTFGAVGVRRVAARRRHTSPHSAIGADLGGVGGSPTGCRVVRGLVRAAGRSGGWFGRPRRHRTGHPGPYGAVGVRRVAARRRHTSPHSAIGADLGGVGGVAAGKVGWFGRLVRATKLSGAQLAANVDETSSQVWAERPLLACMERSSRCARVWVGPYGPFPASMGRPLRTPSQATPSP